MLRIWRGFDEAMRLNCAVFRSLGGFVLHPSREKGLAIRLRNYSSPRPCRVRLWPRGIGTAKRGDILRGEWATPNSHSPFRETAMEGLANTYPFRKALEWRGHAPTDIP